MICRGERKVDRVKCFISYAIPQERFSNFLRGAGLMQVVPVVGHVICHPDTGVPMCRMAVKFKGNPAIQPTEDQIEIFSRPITEKYWIQMVLNHKYFKPLTFRTVIGAF